MPLIHCFVVSMYDIKFTKGTISRKLHQRYWYFDKTSFIFLSPFVINALIGVNFLYDFSKDAFLFFDAIFVTCQDYFPLFKENGYDNVSFIYGMKEKVNHEPLFNFLSCSTRFVAISGFSIECAIARHVLDGSSLKSELNQLADENNLNFLLSKATSSLNIYVRV